MFEAFPGTAAEKRAEELRTAIEQALELFRQAWPHLDFNSQETQDKMDAAIQRLNEEL